MAIKTPTVIYIMGYGRSGSTFLDIVLNNHSEIESVGALSNFFNWVIDNHFCACNKRVRECPFWFPVTESYQNTDETLEVRRQQLLVEEHKTLRQSPAKDLPIDLVENYDHTMTNLFSEIGERNDSRFIVDSSKSAHETRWRAYALSRYTALDMKLIHLVRDGRAVLWSAIKGPGSPERSPQKHEKLRAQRAIIGWVQSNVICSKMGRWLDKPVHTIRYEDLVTNPAQEMARIGNFLNLDMESVINMLETDASFTIGHNLGGNRLRFAKYVQLKADFDWQTKLPRKYKVAFWPFGWSVARRYGYHFSYG